MPSAAKQQLIDAMSLARFEFCRSQVEVPELNRPTARPEGLPGFGRVAAVMILVFSNTDENEPTDKGLGDSVVVLTKRNANLSAHASQISFPGGQQNIGETLQQTALRETQEEVGVAASQIEVLGRLSPVYIPPSDFTVTPFVGWHPGRPSFVRCEAEVDKIIETPLKRLLEPTSLVVDDFIQSGGRSLRVPYYRVGPDKVWGATAVMLGELVERLSQAIQNSNH